MEDIDRFVDAIMGFESSDDVFNQYKISRVADNLREYMGYMKKYVKPKILLVGEAPGYRGARRTGIPFTSQRVFIEHENSFIRKLYKRIHVDGFESENTAKMIWDVCTSLDVVPFMWNSFPFHPHVCGNEFSNRAPRSHEINFGKKCLVEIDLIYDFSFVIGVGNMGFRSVSDSFPHKRIEKVRHPSYGGKNEFIEGMERCVLDFKG